MPTAPGSPDRDSVWAPGRGAVSSYLTDPEQVARLLQGARRIAVVGLSPRPERPSHAVAAYLQRVGYTIVPVTPRGGVILGEPVHRDLRSAAAAGTIDIANIFRRSEHIPALLDDLLVVRPGLVWMQQGIRHEGVAHRLEQEGIPVVMDRCLAVDHHFLRA